LRCNNLQFNATVHCLAGLSVITGDRLVRPHSLSDQAILIHTAGSKMICNGGCSAIRKIVVVVSGAGRVSMTGYAQAGIFVFAEYLP
jgi:hypothetical protein